MRTKKYSFALILFLTIINAVSQDSVFVFDIATQTSTARVLPTYNLNAVADSTNPSFGTHGISSLPTSAPANTYPMSNTSVLQKAADFYTTFNFPFTAVSLIRYGYNITSAVIGRRALLVFDYDVRQPNSHWRGLSDANPFYENGTIQYGFNKLTPVKYYTLNSPDDSKLSVAVVEVAENIGDYAGYFGLAFDTTTSAYDSLLLYNISYPKKDFFNIYPDSTNGDTLCMKYGFIDNNFQSTFQAYLGGNGEYVSPFFDAQYRIRGIRWSLQNNHFISRKEFYFLNQVVDSLATSINEINSQAPWKIFPNPASKNVSILLNSPLKTNASLIILNSIGQIVENRQVSAGELKWDIDVSHLSSGLYSLTILSSDAVQSEKFIKL